jgi:DNA-binding PadR family transcriptional regulator
VAGEAETLVLQAMFCDTSCSRGRNGAPHLVCAVYDDKDRRRRPHGRSIEELAKSARINYWRAERAINRLVEAAYLNKRQPHTWNEEAGRYQGLPNIYEITPKGVAALDIAPEIIGAALAQEEATRKINAQLAAAERAKEQQADRERRGENPDWFHPRKADKKAAVRVLGAGAGTDAEGRRVPGSVEEQQRYTTIAVALRADPAWSEQPSDLQRAEALRRWRSERDPTPT